MTILLVEDDAELARELRAELRSGGDSVHMESRGPVALTAALNGGWDVIIMDVALPGMDGFSIVQSMRAAGVDTPVIFLTAKSDVAHRVRGLALGGDDYLTKPFAKDELKARLNALARRSSRSKPQESPLPEGWSLNPLLRQVSVDGQAVPLQPREWSLLELFLRNEGQVITKSFLLDRVWGIRFDPGTNVVDAMICRLRKKLDRPGRPSHVETLRGRGYVFHRHV